MFIVQQKLAQIIFCQGKKSSGQINEGRRLIRDPESVKKDNERRCQKILAAIVLYVHCKKRHLKVSCSNQKSQTMYGCSISKNIRNQNHPFSSPCYKLHRLSPQVHTVTAHRPHRTRTDVSSADRPPLTTKEKCSPQSLSQTLFRCLHLTANTRLRFFSFFPHQRELPGLDPCLSCSDDAPDFRSSWHTRDA